MVFVVFKLDLPMVFMVSEVDLPRVSLLLQLLLKYSLVEKVALAEVSCGVQLLHHGQALGVGTVVNRHRHSSFGRRKIYRRQDFKTLIARPVDAPLD